MFKKKTTESVLRRREKSRKRDGNDLVADDVRALWHQIGRYLHHGLLFSLQFVNVSSISGGILQWICGEIGNEFTGVRQPSNRPTS